MHERESPWVRLRLGVPVPDSDRSMLHVPENVWVWPSDSVTVGLCDAVPEADAERETVLRVGVPDGEGVGLPGL